MILLGFEIFERGNIYVKVFPILPIAGTIYYTMAPYYLYQVAMQGLDYLIANRYRGLDAYGRDRYIKDYPEQVITSSSCSASEVVIIYAHGALSLPFDMGYGGEMLICALPLKWEGVPAEPKVLVALPTPRVIPPGYCGLLGPLPVISLVKPMLPTQLAVKPGSLVSLEAEIEFSPAAGGIEVFTLANEITGKSAESIHAFNPGERKVVLGEDTMPGLLPDELLSLIATFSLGPCDLSKLVETDEAFQSLTALLSGTLPPPITNTIKVLPTDCMLADTSGGIFQVLGDNLTYSGFVISKDKTGPISGEAPAKISLTDVSFLSLDFSREIATCENRNILDQSSNHYEYSKFPTPRRSAQMTKWAVSTFRPAFVWEGLPLPKYTMEGPKIRVQ